MRPFEVPQQSLKIKEFFFFFVDYIFLHPSLRAVVGVLAGLIVATLLCTIEITLRVAFKDYKHECL